jgi:tetratricopeptide (TPR) repeat protein
MARWVMVVLALGSLATSAAQRPAEVDTLLERAAALQREALASEAPRSPDQARWREVLALARQADDLAPHDLEVERFIARAYSYVRWYSRADQAWLTYLDDGGDLQGGAPEAGTATDAELFAEVGTQLGFARYQAGDLDGALRYYQAVNERLPDDPESLRWLGRIHFERGEADQALPYWQRLVALRPDDDGAAYYLERTEQRLSVGVAASDAYQRGIEAYGKGNVEDALAAFQDALAANQDFTDASVWAGRTSLELDRPRQARDYWRQVTVSRPDDGRARYFLQVAQAEVEWGVAAGKAYYDGQAAYQEGDVAAASEAFTRALTANPDYLDAWVWAARTQQELGNFGDAILYWQGVVQRDPKDDRARYFLDQAKQQLQYGSEAGKAYVDGVEKFQAGAFEDAEVELKRAVAANPDFPEAWGTLGRLYFQQARYHEAADAFDRALALRPGNDDYTFFAKEARRLAGP